MSAKRKHPNIHWNVCKGQANGTAPCALPVSGMKTLFILNDAPYGSERPYNGLRLALSLSKIAGEEVKVFLIGDAAGCAKSGQKVPQGFYNLQTMLDRVGRNGADIGVCGTCLDAR